MEPFLGKKYKLKTSENFDEYLSFIGVGFISRKVVTALSPVMELVLDSDGTYTMTFSTTLKTIVTKFKLNEEFVEDRPDGAKVKSTITVDGNKLIQIQIEDSGRKSTHIREFSPESCITTSTAEGWSGKCVRIYYAV